MKLLAIDIQKDLGTIKPPAELVPFIQKGGDEAGAISLFLSNLITLVYSIAGIILIVMLVWGAFEWITSGGDKEKLSSAQKRIMTAIIGIVIMALAFAIIAVVGTLTGFTFFTGQETFNK